MRKIKDFHQRIHQGDQRVSHTKLGLGFLKKLLRNVPKLKQFDQKDTGPGYQNTDKLFSCQLSINHENIINKLKVFSNFEKDLDFLHNVIKMEFNKPNANIQTDKNEQECIFFMINHFIQKVDFQYLKLFIDGSKQLELQKVKEVLSSIFDICKGIIPRLIKGKNKFYGMAVEAI